MNQSHHDEQMEAQRADFNKLWETVIIPQLKKEKVTGKELFHCEVVAWIAFKAGQQTTRQKHL
jgi:hypothetical protein